VLRFDRWIFDDHSGGTSQKIVPVLLRDLVVYLHDVHAEHEREYDLILLKQTSEIKTTVLYTASSIIERLHVLGVSFEVELKLDCSGV